MHHKSILARDGRSLTARVAGPPNGFPVVLLHGQMHSSSCWNAVLSGPLARDHRLIAPDLAGHGGSDTPRLADTDWMADDLADVLSALGVTDPVLIGWSFGSAVAAAYASGRATRGLVLVSAGTRAPGAHGLSLAQVRAMLDQAAVACDAIGAEHPPALDLFRAMLSDERAVADDGVARMIDTCANGQLDAATRAERIANGHAISLATRAAIAATPYDYADFYAIYDRPILQIHGDRDVVRPVAAAHERKAIFRHGETEIWTGSGHSPFDAEPARFAERIAAFCAAL